jgi:outer membrane protein
MRRLFSVIVVTALALVHAGPSRAETLGDALAQAYLNSNLLDQQRAVLRASDEDSAGAMATLRPVVDFTINGFWRKYNNTSVAPGLFPTPNFETSGATAQLAASMLIYGGGRSKLGLEIARESVMATRAALINVEQEVLLGAVSAYVDLQLQGEIVALRRANVRLITKQLRVARERFELGDATQTDISLAQARLAGGQSALASAEAANQIAAERFKAATGKAPGSLSRLPKAPKLPGTLDEAIALARQNHPLVIQSRHLSRIGELQVDLADALAGPILSAQIGVEENLNSGVDNTFANLGFKQTLYAGGVNSSDSRKALAQKEAAASGLLQTQLSVGEGVARAWANLGAASLAVQAGDLQVRAAQQTLDGVQEELSLGAKTTLDVLNAEQEAMNARVQRLQAAASSYVLAYQVLATTGRLTAENLGLGVPIYDPKIYHDAVKSAPISSPQGKKLDRIKKKIGN